MITSQPTVGQSIIPNGSHGGGMTNLILGLHTISLAIKRGPMVGAHLAMFNKSDGDFMEN